VLHYHAPGTVVKEVERRMRLSELYLRVLTVVVDPRRKLAMEEARIAAEKAAEARATRAAGSDSEEEEEIGAER